jgi:hypothetical protein
MACYVSLEDHELLSQCLVDTYRASGPGGQKRNKTASAIRLRHEPTGVSANAVESRSQHENKAKALKRLRLSIALKIRRHVEIDGYEPSELLRSCISRSGKFAIGRRDERYYAVVWEVVDLLFACKMQVSTAAQKLGLSTANFSAVLRNDPPVWRRVNELRKDEGLSSLK